MPKIDRNTKLYFERTTLADAKIEDAVHFDLLDMTIAVKVIGEDGHQRYVTTEMCRESGLSPQDIIHLGMYQAYNMTQATYTEWMPLTQDNTLVGMTLMHRFRECPKRISIAESSAMLVEYKSEEASLPEILTSMTTLRVLRRMGRIGGRSNIFILPYEQDGIQKILLVPDSKAYIPQIPVWYARRQNKKAAALTVYYYMPTRNLYAVVKNPMDSFWRRGRTKKNTSADLGNAWKMITPKPDKGETVSPLWISVMPPKIHRDPA